MPAIDRTAPAAKLKPPAVDSADTIGVEDLGVFGAMALMSAIQAGSDAGFRRLTARTGLGPRLAPHRALRHRLLLTLLNAGVLAPVGSCRRIDDAVADPGWEDASLEDADWLIVWDDLTRGSLPTRLRTYLDGFVSTPRTREVLLETWQALGIGECLAFGEYALSSHNLNPGLARAAASTLPPILAQQSIAQGCALMWFAAKHLAAWFLRHGGGASGMAELEFTKSIQLNFDRALFQDRPIIAFQRHAAVPLSVLAGIFIWTSRLGETYWTSPISESALDQARPSATD